MQGGPEVLVLLAMAMVFVALMFRATAPNWTRGTSLPKGVEEDYLRLAVRDGIHPEIVAANEIDIRVRRSDAALRKT